MKPNGSDRFSSLEPALPLSSGMGNDQLWGTAIAHCWSPRLPLCQNESKCESILMKICFTYKFIFMQIKLIFIWKALHEDSFWERGTPELGNGLFRMTIFLSSRFNCASVTCWRLRNLKKKLSLQLFWTISSDSSLLKNEAEGHHQRSSSCTFFLQSKIAQIIRVRIFIWFLIIQLQSTPDNSNH